MLKLKMNQHVPNKNANLLKKKISLMGTKPYINLYGSHSRSGTIYRLW